jgi:hypothetical protein
MTTNTVGRTFFVFAAFLATANGCQGVEPLVSRFGLGTVLHPLHELGAVSASACGDCRKEHVYIFGVNGFNPLCLGNFNGLCDYIRTHGFRNTHFGQLHTSHGFAGQVRQVRREDPDARIVLIGFSGGANYVKWIANALAHDCTHVDLLVYLAGDCVPNTPSSYPANVGRVVNIRGKGLILTGGDLFFNGADIDGARNYQLHCRHILAPSRRETIEIIMKELLALACAPYGGAPAPPSDPVRTTAATRGR